jgi:hypothetical protein
LRDTNHLILDF